MTKTQMNKITAAAKRIAKNNKTQPFKHTENYSGKTYVVDGHRVVRFYETLDLPEDSRKGTIREQMDNLLKDRSDSCYNRVQLPDIKELKSTMKFVKEKTKKLEEEKGYKIPKDLYYDWYLGENEDGSSLIVNPYYLIDIMESLPGCCCFSDGKYSTGLLLFAENGEAVLLPRRKTETRYYVNDENNPIFRNDDEQ